MDISQNGIDFIKGFEGLELTAYKALPTEPYWTIGYGHYGSDVRQGQTITVSEAENLLKNDLRNYINCVNTSVHVPLNQNQFDSLVSFCYNVGCSAFQSSTLLQKLNNRDYNGASSELSLWVHSGGNVIQGLVSRRNAEQVLFNKPVPTPIVIPDKYVVQFGENLTEIANKFGLSVSQIMQMNPSIQNENVIQAGQTLYLKVGINTTQSYTIRSGENLTTIAQRMGTTVNVLKGLNPQIKNENLVFAGQVIRVPVK